MTTPFRQVRVFLDICHAGNIAMIEALDALRRPAARRIEGVFLPTGNPPGAGRLRLRGPGLRSRGVYVFSAARLEHERRRVGSGNFVTANSLSDYVEKWVGKATEGPKDKGPRQKPSAISVCRARAEIADLNLPGESISKTPGRWTSS